ncbi:MAG: metallophosphatase family protein [Candidatus Omnitrophica bacterium]|nr:metallophosphatase family protein [Candidatus Omnitrophota bacterium]
MKIGVISDTHSIGNEICMPQKMIEDFKDIDMLIHAGDIVDLAFLNKLKDIYPNVKAVWGNMDPCEVRRALPQKEIISLSKYKIGLMHGWGAPSKLIDLLKQSFKDDNVNIIIFGHSHQPMNETIDGVLYFNPGSPTDKIFAPYNSYGIMRVNDRIEAEIIKL